VKVLFVVSLLLVAAVVATPAGGERQADLLVRHGESIGKVKLGMTLLQVRQVLGRERAVNKREKRGTRGYVYLELDWDYLWWTVGFMRAPGGKYRAVSIGTIQQGQRTPERLGPRSTEGEVYGKLRVDCRNVFPAKGTRRGNFLHGECVYRRPRGRQTVFVLSRWQDKDDPLGVARVAQVEVRDALFYRGWPVRFEPRCPPGVPVC
jgi:hypothetical protein